MKHKKSFSLSEIHQILEPGHVVMVTTCYKEKTNIMTMAWHTMMEFEPALVGCVISNQNYSFDLLRKSKECVINVPTVELAPIVVGVGNCSGRKVDKFKKFNLTPEAASQVNVPMINECYANLECKVVDTKMVAKYNFFVLEVVKAWVHPSKKRQRTIHHCGYGKFVVDGKIIKLKSHKK